MTTSKTARLQRVYMALVGVAAATAVAAGVFAAWATQASNAAPTVAPTNTGEPSISGSARVGQVLRSTRGAWTGTEPITFAFRWFRCDGPGRPDASDCRRISSSGDSYVLRQSDAGFRIRSQVVASNAEGSARATSNPTDVVLSSRPTNVTNPTISGAATVGSRLHANTGDWAGDQPITFALAWLRCGSTGGDCGTISGATDSDYVVRDADSGHTLRVRVTARNNRGSSSEISGPTAVVGSSTSGGLDVGSLQAAGDRLLVAQVQFSPNPVTSSTAPITARVKVTARNGRPVSGARVFMRGTPRVVQGQTQVTGGDGFATLTLVPNRLFPTPRSGFNVQFFVKAFRSGDPALGGIAGFRLVQVRLAGGA
jgi:hypothetical protein